jgi:MFS family permease
LDAYGPRVCLLVAQSLVFLGCACFAQSSHFWEFAVGVILMSFGGPGMGISIIHVANLFPRNQFLAVSCLAGSVTLSFSILAILESIWENYHVGFRTLFGGYCGLIVASMLGTLLCSPNVPFELEKDKEGETDAASDSYKDSYKDEANNHPSLEQEFVEATIHTYAHHHQNHLWMTDQSLNDRLRSDVDDSDTGTSEMEDGHGHHNRRWRHLNKTHSFFQSKQAIKSGNQKALELMSLKDQSFYVQLTSHTFARAVLIFISVSFFANFTIASLNTELEDLPKFTLPEQHSLSQQFTWLLSLGMLYAVLVGWLMDKAGLEVCTLLTLLLGQISTLLILVAAFFVDNSDYDYPIMIAGFCLYSLFRQFLFPVFLAYITARLGFKYFGILSGIGFALSGMAQWTMAALVQFVHHSDTEGCHWWLKFHVLQIFLLAWLMMIPIADHKEVLARQAQMEQALQQWKPRSPGSIATAPTSTNVSPLILNEELRRREAEYGSLLDESAEEQR